MDEEYSAACTALDKICLRVVNQVYDLCDRSFVMVRPRNRSLLIKK